MSYVLNTASHRTWATNVLVYMATQLKCYGDSVFDFVDMSGKNGFSGTEKAESTTFGLGDGKHKVEFEDSIMDVEVKTCFTDDGAAIVVNSYAGTIIGKRIVISGLKNNDQMKRLLEATSKFIVKMAKGSSKKACHYLFECRHFFFNRMQAIYSISPGLTHRTGAEP